MRFINCYIESFGCLENKQIDFNEGITSIVADNGSGKTTLTVFIKAMLFGLGDTRRTSLDENDRKKYLPWGKRNAGGMLRIEADGVRYRIERSFGKTPSEDSVTVYNEGTGLPLSLECEIGERLLGLDREAFERTLLLSEKRQSGKIDNSYITSRMSSVVGYAPDIKEYEAARLLLEEKAKFYKHKKGVGGKIDDLRAECDRLELQIKELDSESERAERLAEELAAYREEKERLLAEERGTEELLRLEAARGERERAYQRYEALRRERAEAESALSELRSRLGEEAPTREMLDAIGDKLSLAESLGSDTTTAKHTDPEEQEPPSATALEAERMREAAKRLNEINGLISNIDGGTDPAAKRMKELFDTEPPSAAELAAAASPRKIILFSFILAASLALAALGGVPGILIAIPVALLSVINIVRPINRRRALLKRYSNTKSIKELSDRLEEYSALSRGREAERESLESERAALTELLTEFFDRLGISRWDNPEECMNDVVRRAEEASLRRLGARAAEAERAERSRRAEEILAECRAFFSRYSLPAERASLTALRQMLDGYERQTMLRARLDEECRRYESELPENRPLPEKSAVGASERRAELLLEINSLTRKIALTEREIEDALLRTEERAELLSTLSVAREELLGSERRLEIIKKTLDAFEVTHRSMTERYIGKTRDAFNKYASLLSGFGEYNIDTSFVLTKTDGGKTRAEESYSRGTRDMYALCMRLALSDSLYEGELPPLILDDPFAAFDDGRFAAARALLKKLAKERQIIYFTCSKSRDL
ncbi:MAG: AAA family ATPase [Clostridia bacterium]|nr:AAA family ATPase [Clostridia bacterium]